ncbi:Restriction endonuclease [Pelotomaculum sp. FP]|uniref:restriction endonuclease n=1 Tax=Pelotomaculum sp. FP TaxID=261474 RepID=UPI0010669DA3|nr:restriction endonuclease [Pelotomaculum sp. FP]TEB15146.1 Restriction endonuclease [Pelotomaculum sp. FP]
MQLNGWSMAWDLVKATFQIFYLLWWVFALAILLAVLKALPNWIMNYRARAAGVDKVDKMNGEMFEIWLGHQFSKAGYDVKHTRYQKDHGADLIITAPGGVKIAVQAKKLSKRKDRVGAKVLGEVLRGKEYYDCDQSMVVTNQGYTEQARNEASRFGIELIDREKLIEFVRRINLKTKNK